MPGSPFCDPDNQGSSSYPYLYDDMMVPQESSAGRMILGIVVDIFAAIGAIAVLYMILVKFGCVKRNNAQVVAPVQDVEQPLVGETAFRYGH
jgi:hypothetical protein